MTTLGDYELLNDLGDGGSANVRRARNVTSTNDEQEFVAIKILRKESFNLAELIKTEVVNMMALEHVNILKVIGHGSGEISHVEGHTEEVYFIVLELAEEGSLFDFVGHTGRLNERVARYFFQQILSGLSYMHGQMIVHRDMKPENVLLKKNFVLKISDFGLSGPLLGREGSGFCTT